MLPHGRMVQLEKQVGTVNDQLVAAQKAATAAKAQLDQAVAGANFWKAELAFVNNLSALNQQLGAARNDFVAKAEVASQKLENLKAVQADVQRANQVRDAAKQSVSDIEMKIRSLKGIK